LAPYFPPRQGYIRVLAIGQIDSAAALPLASE
jgi:hypothetical protein